MWCVISGFHREADENCAVLGYYAASTGNTYVSDVLEQPIGPFFMGQKRKGGGEGT